MGVGPPKSQPSVFRSTSDAVSVDVSVRSGSRPVRGLTPDDFRLSDNGVPQTVTSVAIEDNTSPAEKRSGASDRYSNAALVRGGAMLIQRLAPEMADGYARYYLRAARVPVTGDAAAALAKAFPLPDAIRNGIQRQLDVVLGGI